MKLGMRKVGLLHTESVGANGRVLIGSVGCALASGFRNHTGNFYAQHEFWWRALAVRDAVAKPLTLREFVETTDFGRHECVLRAEALCVIEAPGISHGHKHSYRLRQHTAFSWR